MRHSTKHKLYGRVQLVQAIRTMLQNLEEASKAADKPGLNAPAIKAHLQTAINHCLQAAGAMDIYKVERKRIRTALEREKKHMSAILEMAKAIPITQEEKVVAKVTRAKKKAVKKR